MHRLPAHELVASLRRLAGHIVHREDLEPLGKRALGERLFEDRRDLRQRLEIEQAPRRVREPLIAQQVFAAEGSQHRHVEGIGAAGHEHPAVVGGPEQPVHGKPAGRAERAGAVAVEVGHLGHFEIADLHGTRAGHLRNGVGRCRPVGSPCVQARCGCHRPEHSGPVGGQRHHQLDGAFGVADLVPADAGHGGHLRRGACTGRVRSPVAPGRARDDHRARRMSSNGRSGGTVGHEHDIGASEQSTQRRRGHRRRRRPQDAGQRRRRSVDIGRERGSFPFDAVGHRRALVAAHRLEARVGSVRVAAGRLHLDHFRALIGQETRRVRPGDACGQLHHPYAAKAPHGRAARCTSVVPAHRVDTTRVQSQ